MALLDTAFTCSNGHSFTANAKSRSRCPECGVLVKKDFSNDPEKTPSTNQTKQPIKEPILVKAGRPRAVTKKKPIPHARVKPVSVKPVLSKVAGGQVRAHKVTGKVAASVSRPPNKTNVTKQAHAAAEAAGARGESYYDKMRRMAGLGR